MITDRMNKEFPHFPPLESDVLALLQTYGFTVDTSWHNEICPSFSLQGQQWAIYIDHPDAMGREVPSRPRFAVYRLDADQLLDEVPAVAVETVAELKAELALIYL